MDMHRTAIVVLTAVFLSLATTACSGEWLNVMPSELSRAPTQRENVRLLTAEGGDIEVDGAYASRCEIATQQRCVLTGRLAGRAPEVQLDLSPAGQARSHITSIFVERNSAEASRRTSTGFAVFLVVLAGVGLACLATYGLLTQMQAGLAGGD
jgi:hypothetical protein